MDVPSGVESTGPVWDRSDENLAPATAEMSRSQVWRWLHGDVELSNGLQITRELVERMIDAEMARMRGQVGDDVYSSGHWDDAATFTGMAVADDHPDVLTLPAFERVP